MEIGLLIHKGGIMAEVAEATAYAAAKAEPGSVADAQTAEIVERVSTVEEDAGLLERFWDECRSEVYSVLKGVIVGDEKAPLDAWYFTLHVSPAFDSALRGSMEESLREFFVQGVLGRWFSYTHKAGAQGCLEKSRALLEDIDRKVWHRKAPIRTGPTLGKI